MNGNGSVDLFQSIRETAKPSGRGGAGGGPVCDDADAFPCLLTLLTQVPKGASRNAKAGRIAVFVYNGRLSVAVNIPASKHVAYYTPDGFLDLFQRLETAVREGKLQWRDDS